MCRHSGRFMTSQRRPCVYAMKVGKEVFIRSAPLGPKNLIEHLLIDLIPEQCIRESLRVPATELA
jgi:hypothetical protein